MAKSPKDWHFMGLNHVFHIFSTSNVQFSGEIHPVFAPQWPRSSLPRASGNSSPRKENSEGGVRIYTEIQRYYIILYYICVNMYIYIYDYFHIYVYIYIWSHTHTRAETPPEALKYLHLSTSSASPHRLLHPIDIENKKNNEFGDLPPPNPKVDLLFWGRWFGCFGFLASPPKPKVGLQFFLLKAGLLFLGGSSPQPKTGHPKWEYACSFWCFVGMWWAKNLNMCMVHGYIYVMFLGSTRCKTLQTCSKNL